MQPLGRVPTRFPKKRDWHLGPKVSNWWETGVDTSSKKAARQAAKKEIRDALYL